MTEKNNAFINAFIAGWMFGAISAAVIMHFSVILWGFQI